MQPAPHEKNQRWPAPCRDARRLLQVTVILSGLIVLVTAAHLLWQGSRHHACAGRWMNALALSAPALWTAGSPKRHPETLHPGIDLRFTAGMEIVP